MKFKHILFLILSLLGQMKSFGQELTIVSLKEAPQDLAARRAERLDLNGDACALLKVNLPVRGAEFEPTTIGEVTYVVNEYWVYLPKDSKRIKIKHPDYLTLTINFEDYGIKKLESHCTYHLAISAPRNNVITKSSFLYVNTNPEGANIVIDGEVRGQTPMQVPNLSIGDHLVTITHPNYKTETKTVRIEYGKNNELELVLTPYYKLGINTRPSHATLYINDVEKGKTPYYEEKVLSGTYDVKITKPGYKDLNKTITLKTNSSEFSFKLKRQYQQRNSFYIAPYCQVFNYVAPGMAIGGYFSNVNIEAGYSYGLTKSENIYWIGNSTTPIPAHYTPTMNVEGKVGYGLICGTRFRITPQVGCHFIKLSEDIANSKPLANGANTTNITAGVRFAVAIVNHLEFMLSPSYDYSITSSEGFKVLSKTSNEFKQWQNGFNVKIGISTYF